MAKPYRRTGSRFWWIAPYIDGKQRPQSSGETEHDAAERKLKILEGKIAANAPITAQTDRGSFDALLELVRDDYQIKRRPSLPAINSRIKHISQHLGSLPAGKVGRAEIRTYIKARQTEAAADASINRELALIKRAFRLGGWDGLVSATPHIEMLPEDNARQGFFSEEQFRMALRHVAPLLRDILTVSYFTGWRLQSVVTLEWRNIDLKGGCLRLWSQNTKNKKATIFPLAPFPELRQAIESRWAERKDLIPYVFHQDGAPVSRSCITKRWQRCRKAAGLPGMRIHDLRRTAVRQLVSHQLDEGAIMNMVGLKTRSIFDRYNISVEADILTLGEAMAIRMGVRNA